MNVKKPVGGGSSRNVLYARGTRIFEYIYLFHCLCYMHNVKSCLSVSYPVYKISQLKTHCCSISLQEVI